MVWEFVNAKKEFTKFSSDWDQLNSKLNNSHPMLDSRFVSTLLEYFASDSLQLAIYYDRTTVLNMLLLEKENVFKWKTFQPSQTQIGCYLISNEKAIKPLIKKLGLFSIILDMHCLDASFSSEISESVDDQYFHAKTFNIQNNHRFDEYWDARPRKLRQNVRRYIKRASLDFERVELNVIDEQQKLATALSYYGNIETQGWKGKIGTAINIMNVQGEFYNKIIEKFSPSRQFKIYELYFGDVLVASRMAITNSEMLLMLKTTYLEEYKKYAPGRTLLYRVLEHEFVNGTQETIEFYTNASSDQLEWSTSDRNIDHIRIFRNKTIKLLVNFLKTIKNIIKKTL